MAKRKITPEGDYERAAKNLMRNYGNVIKDRTTFEKAFKEYFETDITDFGKTGLKKFQSKVFGEITSSNPDVSKGRRFDPVAVENAPEEDRGPERFKEVGKIRNKIVFVREIQTKAGKRYIDKKGRYASLNIERRPRKA